MKTHHDLLKQAAMQALNDLFSDKSVDRDTTKESLGEISEEIATMFTAMRDDEKKGTGE